MSHVEAFHTGDLSTLLPPGNTTDVYPLDSLADRVWYAWHCLPRDKRGHPPSWKSLELKYDISPATFSKLCNESRRSVDMETWPKLEEALRVPAAWLIKGEGKPPMPTGPIPDRRARYGIRDGINDGVQRYDALGRVTFVGPVNNFEVAVSYLRHELDTEDIVEVAIE